ncbi:hypothetical protein [Nostoc punctiforme]|uniref:Uncharacterized protein n=1 Tax=Nostoc punctiforme (strain ATCC 29133 / PCC 73102) TaxID=63737 RepID=B2IV16_NOSP7|nr:hypothetical protein [Nostoc punctiforme]ACC84409.1 conserved hypothetical protein [Nostoc punctiforme PCC 73102]
MNNNSQGNQSNPNNQLISISNTNSNTGGYVTLPIASDQFQEFIVALLGRPQTIEKIIAGSFELNWNDIQNFNDLIDQRLTQKNQAVLISFQSKIYFNDDSSILLNSFQELITYREIRPIIPTALDMSWDYLIHFNNKQHPEKQTIDIHIQTAYHELVGIGRNKRNEIMLENYNINKNFIQLSIKYTARTWGMDMQSLLASQINSLIKIENSQKRFVNKHSTLIGAISGTSFFLGSIIGTYLASNAFIKNRLNKVNYDLNRIQTLPDKINIIAQYIVNGETPRYYLLAAIYILLSLIASFIIFAIVFDKANNEKRSFILLTDKAIQDKESTLKKIDKKWKEFILSIVISFIVNVLSSYLFAYITR